MKTFSEVVPGLLVGHSDPDPSSVPSPPLGGNIVYERPLALLSTVSFINDLTPIVSDQSFQGQLNSSVVSLFLSNRDPCYGARSRRVLKHRNTLD